MNPRYESAAIAALWSDRNRNDIERQFWVHVMGAQREMGIAIPADAIDAYHDLALSQNQLDPDSEEVALELQDIAELEKETRHDLYARLRWFNESVGSDYAHRGLTSSDITENTQQIQIATSAEVLLADGEQVLRRLHRLIRDTAEVPTVARTHGRPAQLTTIGKRAADWVHELLSGMISLQTALDGYTLRGVKGAVGTNADMARTLSPEWRAAPDADQLGRVGASVAMAAYLDARLARLITGDPSSMVSVGQCYQRSADMPIVSAAMQLAAACGTFANAIRLMAALGLVVENPERHVGSSAMPHKSNPRYAERVHSLQVVARGYAGMLQELAGSQWLEGDVSTSAARRVALPGLFHAVDAMLANTAWILDHMEFDRLAIRAEVDIWMPEMASGALLAALVEAGMPRGEAHGFLRHHYGQIGNAHSDPQRLLNLVICLSQDDSCPLSTDQIEAAFNVEALLGTAVSVAYQMADPGLAEMAEDLDEEWPGDLV